MSAVPVDVPAFYATVSDLGKLELSDTQRKAMARWTRTLAGQEVEVLVRKRTRRRSSDQNRAWWGLIIPAITAGCDMDPNSTHDKELVHYGLVEKCFGVERNEKLGVDLPKARSSKLTTKEFSYLMDWAAKWAAEELGIYVPLPDDLAA